MLASPIWIHIYLWSCIILKANGQCVYISLIHTFNKAEQFWQQHLRYREKIGTTVLKWPKVLAIFRINGHITYYLFRERFLRYPLLVKMRSKTSIWLINHFQKTRRSYNLYVHLAIVFLNSLLPTPTYTNCISLRNPHLVVMHLKLSYTISLRASVSPNGCSSLMVIKGFTNYFNGSLDGWSQVNIYGHHLSFILNEMKS